jgi:hypothetical protein
MIQAFKVAKHFKDLKMKKNSSQNLIFDGERGFE